jgi:hypothetical protein
MRTVIAAIAALVSALPAFAADTPADYAQATLREGCAQSYASHSAYHPTGSAAPAFVGERYRGDNRYYNNAAPCDETQYAAYLEKADPATVTMAYPTGAGKKAKAKKPGAAASATGRSK